MTNKLSTMEVMQKRIDKATSKPISLGERPRGSWELRPERELFCMLYQDNLHKKDKYRVTISILKRQ